MRTVESQLYGRIDGRTARDEWGRDTQATFGHGTGLDQRDRRALHQCRSGHCIEHLTRGTHPGTQHARVCGLMMMRVMRFV